MIKLHSKSEELTKEEITQEMLIYRYKNLINIGAHAAKRAFKKNKNIQVKFEFNQKGLNSNFKINDRLPIEELMVIMSHVLDENSEIHFKKIFRLIINLDTTGKVLQLVNDFDNQYTKIKKGLVPLRVNDRELTQEKAYFYILENILKNDDTYAIKHENILLKKPYGSLIWFQAYNFILDAHTLLIETNRTLNREKLFPKEVKRNHLCIYCLKSEGSFFKLEHTLPESFGNHYSILPRGWACDTCQEQFSTKEEIFLNTLPFSMMRLYAVDYNKKGRFPKAIFENIHLSKTRPNKLTIKQYGGKKIEINTNDENSETNFKITSISRKFNLKIISQVLIKAALGGIALEKGRNYVLDSKFNPAREFSLKGIKFKGKLMIQKTNDKIHPNMSITFIEDSEIAIFTIYGLKIIISLVPDVLPPPPLEIFDQLIIHDLNIDTDDKSPEGYNWLKNEYIKLISDHPSDYIIWHNLGCIYQDKLMKDQEAIKAYEKALDINPKWYPAWYNLGKLYQNDISNNEQAMNAYNQCLKIAPNDDKAWTNLGLILKNSKRYQEAEDAYNNAINFNVKNYVAYNNLGLLYVELQQLSQAENAFRRSTKINSKFVNGYVNLGSSLYFQNKLVEAESAYKLALNLEPKNYKIMHTLGKIYQDQEKMDEAEEIYLTINKKLPNHKKKCFCLGLFLLDSNEFNQAEEFLIIYLKKNPKVAAIHYNLACLYAKQKIVEKSIFYLDEAFVLDPHLKSNVREDDDFSEIWNNKSFQDLITS